MHACTIRSLLMPACWSAVVKASFKPTLARPYVLLNSALDNPDTVSTCSKSFHGFADEDSTQTHPPVENAKAQSKYQVSPLTAAVKGACQMETRPETGCASPRASRTASSPPCGNIAKGNCSSLTAAR